MSDQIRNIEEKLYAARERLQKAAEALAPKHKGGEWEEFWRTSDAALALERELAIAKGEQYAIPLDFPVEWDTGAPLPHLFRSDCQTLLSFYVRDPDPNWDGTYVNIKSPGNGSENLLALVEFEGCVSAKLGSPNEEIFQGHPLHGRGLESYTAQEVKNSIWLAELEAINKAHEHYDPERWVDQKHFVFWFHDSTFECVASGFTVNVYRETMAALLERVCHRLLR